MTPAIISLTKHPALEYKLINNVDLHSCTTQNRQCNDASLPLLHRPPLYKKTHVHVHLNKPNHSSITLVGM